MGIRCLSHHDGDDFISVKGHAVDAEHTVSGFQISDDAAMVNNQPVILVNDFDSFIYVVPAFHMSANLTKINVDIGPSVNFLVNFCRFL